MLISPLGLLTNFHPHSEYEYTTRRMGEKLEFHLYSWQGREVSASQWVSTLTFFIYSNEWFIKEGKALNFIYILTRNIPCNSGLKEVLLKMLWCLILCEQSSLCKLDFKTFFVSFTQLETSCSLGLQNIKYVLFFQGFNAFLWRKQTEASIQGWLIWCHSDEINKN